ncbi:MAG: hypothetical protein JOZ67_03270 [Gammaproteobacteria bacterium]|nr:hypothetical protein [Gammaproteobacteria bacterium]
MAGCAGTACLLLGACSSGGYGTVGSPDLTGFNGAPGGGPAQKAAGTALFQPLQGVLPYPTDLYFAGSTDGTVRTPPLQTRPSWQAVNGLDGFSTTAAIRENFQGALDPNSFTPASVIVVPVVTDNKTKATVGVLGPPLTQGIDYSVGVGPEAGVGSSILEIKPLHPLMPSTCISNGQFLGAHCTTGTGYLVILTNGIKDAGGHPAVPDADYLTIETALAGGASCPSITNPQLNGICQLTGAQLQIAQALGIHPASIVLTFSFTTESTVDTLGLLSAVTAAQPAAPLTVHATPLTTADIPGLGLPGLADIYVGTLTVPYYLSKAAPDTEHWHAPPFPLDMTSTAVTRYNPLPVPTQMLQIPVLLTAPHGQVAPAGGWPVLIFQHGITQNRENIFGLADTFAASGYVVVAIDLPLHGITNPMDPLYASGANPLYAGLNLPAAGSIERTFDLATNGVIDGSGSHFINLKSLLTSRDNLRQGAADLLVLARALPGLNLGAAGSLTATGPTQFLGHSLGGIVGGTFLGVVSPLEVLTGTLAMPGGEVAQLLRDSPTFSVPINQGLTQLGAPPGTTSYEQFFIDAQTAVDSGDPINFIALATTNHPVHLIEVVGTSAATADQVVPNSATQRLIVASQYGATGLVRIPAPPAPGPLVSNAGNPPGWRAYVQFTQGNHGSIIDPTASLAATQEMQAESVTFTGAPFPAAGFPATPPGSTILVIDPLVIAP